MLFNSIEFVLFFIIVFVLYWLIPNNKVNIQNVLLLIVSYVFYGWWNWRFLFLLALLSVANYLIGLLIDKNRTTKRGKTWLIIGLIINIGTLCVFKYFNFFIAGFIDLVSLIGYSLPEATTKIIIPLGISFYVFLSLSYLIDIYKKNLNANRNIVEVLLTLSFFPIILAGPIQRPASLLPQIAQKREFIYDKAIDGLRQILWGLFAKVVIADNLAIYVNEIFKNYNDYTGSTLLIGAGFYTLQIYADFSGYSNLALGIGKLLGFNLMQNFSYPYFSRDITEFWKRWHISLTTWFRDYVFLPLSFNVSWKINAEKVICIKTDLLIYLVTSTVVWFLTGLWHGANYTFIVWGLIHGLFLIVYRIQIKPRKRLFKKLRINNNNLIIVTLETFITLFVVIIAWVFFRAENINHSLNYLSRIFSSSLFKSPIQDIRALNTGYHIVYLLFSSLVFITSEWIQKNKQYALQLDNDIVRKGIRWAIYYLLIFACIWMNGVQQEFVYYQF